MYLTVWALSICSFSKGKVTPVQTPYDCRTPYDLLCGGLQLGHRFFALVIERYQHYIFNMVCLNISVKASECAIRPGGGLGKGRCILPFHCLAHSPQREELQITPTILAVFNFVFSFRAFTYYKVK